MSVPRETRSPLPLLRNPSETGEGQFAAPVFRGGRSNTLPTGIKCFNVRVLLCVLLSKNSLEYIPVVALPVFYT